MQADSELVMKGVTQAFVLRGKSCETFPGEG